jgi:plasmid stabilization system protein ParE
MAKEVKYTLVWTEPAICDLERIDRYLRRRNPAAAEKLGEGLLKRVSVLMMHPEFGRLYDAELPWRVLPHRSYKVFYRVLRESRVVEIAHVRHAARDNPTLDDLMTD